LAFPLLELVGIYLVWQTVGAWTLAWLAGALLAGFMLLVAEHLSFMSRLAEGMLNGRHPIELILASGQRFVAAVLLIVPGPLSDVLAVGLVLRSVPWPHPSRPARASAADGVIEGEFRRLD